MISLLIAVMALAGLAEFVVKAEAKAAAAKAKAKAKAPVKAEAEAPALAKAPVKAEAKAPTSVEPIPAGMVLASAAVWRPSKPSNGPMAVRWKAGDNRWAAREARFGNQPQRKLRLVTGSRP